MSLLEEARPHHRRQGGTCTLATLEPPVRQEIDATLGRATDTAIARALRARGIEITSYTLGRHRRRDCQCPS